MAPIETTQGCTRSQAGTSMATPEVTIREYQAADHDAILSLFATGMLLYATENVEFWQQYVTKSIAGDLARIDEVYKQPGGNFWVATIANEVVGMVALEKKAEGEGELRRMSVKTEARRFGVGRLLVAHLENWARKNGYTKVWLSTGAVMTQARKFYLSLDYEHTHTDVYNHPLVSFEIVYFAKSVAVSA